MKHIIENQEKNSEIIILGIVLLFFFVFMRLFTFTLQMIDIDLPFRVMLAIAIIFGLVFPLAIIFTGFREISMLTSVLIPFIIFGIVTPVLDSALLGYSFITNPDIIQFYLLGGVGFGIAGIGANRIKANWSQTVFLLLIGVIVILLNAPNYIRVIPFIITGDTSYIAGYLDLA